MERAINPKKNTNIGNSPPGIIDFPIEKTRYIDPAKARLMITNIAVIRINPRIRRVYTITL